MKRNRRSFRESLYGLFVKSLPKNVLSRLAGAVAQWQLPGPIMKWLLKAFVRKFSIDMSEAQKPLESYSSLQELFTRRLKEGARRPVEGGDVIVSPCDGAYGQSGKMENGTLLQVKGRSFKLDELLQDDEWSANFEGGSYAVLYLSPRDYHRFHSPCDIRVVQAAHVPGKLWPVNLWAVAQVENLFCINERVIMKAELPFQKNNGLAIIAVGATMVGKVKVEFDNALTTNVAGAKLRRVNYDGQSSAFAKGQELGRFEFGSTIVIALSKKNGSLDSKSPGTPIKMGQRIGTLSHEDASNEKANHGAI